MIDNNNIPRHIAIIMDGNGRWAKERGRGRTYGHRQGTKVVKEIIRFSSEIGLEALTLFAFSAENWDRPKSEISMLMRYLDNFLDREIKELVSNNIRLLFIGRQDPLPRYLQEKMKKAQALTSRNTGLTLVLALNYGSRQEIVDAAKKFARSVAGGEIDINSLNEENFSDYFYTVGLPDPDLLIRTSGEMRLSNFLLWQLSYAELFFLGKYWPDFTNKDLEAAIRVYQKRERRFGRVDVAPESN
ncbi:MAG: isoprenyl transferase [Candidatus Omnitrophica bacterium]|nr:isoprenyl transferase [Candidatus Omnitrophota bacterium]